ncbi:hypothetical protein [Slackia exigua]
MAYPNVRIERNAAILFLETIYEEMLKALAMLATTIRDAVIENSSVAMESSCPCIDGAVHENSALAENRGIHHPRAEESFAHAEREPIETLGS